MTEPTKEEALTWGVYEDWTKALSDAPVFGLQKVGEPFKERPCDTFRWVAIYKDKDEAIGLLLSLRHDGGDHSNLIRHKLPKVDRTEPSLAEAGEALKVEIDFLAEKYEALREGDPWDADALRGFLLSEPVKALRKMAGAKQHAPAQKVDPDADAKDRELALLMGGKVKKRERRDPVEAAKTWRNRAMGKVSKGYSLMRLMTDRIQELEGQLETIQENSAP